MKHITEDWNQNMCSSALWDFYFRGMRTGSLDIETTGLDPVRNKFILGGIYCAQAQCLHQVLAENRAEEPDALAAYMETFAGLDVVVTYNGRRFDIPFLDVRLKHCRIPYSCGHVYNLDLYQVLSGHSPLRKFVPNMKQKTIENYMGLWETRIDEISGAESAELYDHYEATKDPATEAKVLLHNNDDVRQLTRLTKAITKSDFHKAMFKLGFPVKAGERLLTIRRIRLERDVIRVDGLQNRMPVIYQGFDSGGWPVASRFSEEGFEMHLPLIRQKGLAIADLEAAGLDEEPFLNYPECAGGFLVLEDRSGINYRQTNHFLIEYIKKFMEENL